MTFLRAAELYEDYRDPSPGDRNRIAKLVGVVGDKLVSEITQADLVDAARRLYPHAAAATRNRAVIKPGAAILHYAANNHWCAWQRIQRFREPRPETRAAPVEPWLQIPQSGFRGICRWLSLGYSRQAGSSIDTRHARNERGIEPWKTVNH